MDIEYCVQCSLLKEENDFLKEKLEEMDRKRYEDGEATIKIIDRQREELNWLHKELYAKRDFTLHSRKGKQILAKDLVELQSDFTV